MKIKVQKQKKNSSLLNSMAEMIKRLWVIESTPPIRMNEVQASATKHSCLHTDCARVCTCFRQARSWHAGTLPTYLFFCVEGVEVVVICQFYSAADVFQSKQTNTVHSIHRPERKTDWWFKQLNLTQVSKAIIQMVAALIWSYKPCSSFAVTVHIFTLEIKVTYYYKQ